MEKTDQHLIVGLGNPESEYGDTRHNLGFACARELARRLGVEVNRKRWKSLIGRSGAGHNGVLSIISALGTKDFARFRVGIGRPSHRSTDVGVRYVLGRFTKAESEKLEKVVAGVADALEMALESGLERAADRYNRAGAMGCEEPQ